MNRDSHGLLTPVALLCLVLLVFSGAAIAQLMAASWRSVLRVDADTESASVLRSAINIVDSLATGIDSTGTSRTPQQACEALHNHAPSTPPSDCSALPTDWTAWMSLPGRNGCDGNVLEGCWRVRFSTTDIVVDLEGQTQQQLTGRNVEVQAAARCDLLPTASEPAEQWCEVVTDPTPLFYEPLTLPLYSSIVGSPLLIAEMIAAATAAGVDFGPSPPAADTEVDLRGTYGGIFVNNAGNVCTTAGSGEECGESAGQAITLENVNVADGACTADPAVLSRWVPLGVQDPTAELATYVPGSGQVVVSAADDGDPTTPANGNLRITGNIDGDDLSTPELEVLLVVSGCHIIIDGPCVYDTEDPGTGVVTPADPNSEQPCDGTGPSDAVPDTEQRTDITLRNVILVTAGGVWTADLEPGPNACPVPDDPNTPLVDESIPGYRAPPLTITGAVISGHAGATSFWEDCDNNPLTPTHLGANGREQIIAGVDRIGSLPPADEWAAADIAWWPGRDRGVWRRR